MDTFYITTPIYYANSLPHLGHLYTMIVADSVHRFKEQRGIETYFLTGTDEHGINIERAAERAGRSPKEQADYVVGYYERMTSEFGLDTEHGGYDIFMRTTSPFHAKGVSVFWNAVAKAKTPKGREAIYKGHYEGWFCAACAAYKTEDEYSKGPNTDDPPRCLIHETALDRVSEESYFFRLSDYDEALLKLYENRDFIRPESRRNEVISFVRNGLQDLSISRLSSSVSWGIPVPSDPNHTVYVWFDALTNYITAIGYGNAERQRAVGFEKFWPAVHLVGKDILRFHAVYWPAFLMAAGVAQPTSVIAHGMWLDADGRKMSKTLGNTVELDVLQRHFSVDAIRYFCLREMVFGQDGRFGYEGLVDRTNSDLASGLGNLLSRALTMIQRYCSGRIPSRVDDSDENTLAEFFEVARDQFVQHFENYAFSRALEVAWSIVARVDKMITEAKPWDLAKDENQRQTLNAVLYRAAESLRWLSVLLYPVLPRAAEKIYFQLGLPGSPSSVDPAHLTWGGLPESTAIKEIEPLFPRLDKAKLMAQIKEERERKGIHMTEADAVEGGPGTQDSRPSPPLNSATQADVGGERGKGFIDINDFTQIDLRVGEVLTCERIPKSDKLLLMRVDVGEETPRQILAGIAEFYQPEALIGRKLVIVANLKPRKLRGHESQGMVLAASVDPDGRPVVATFTEDVPNGARLK